MTYKLGHRWNKIIFRERIRLVLACPALIALLLFFVLPSINMLFLSFKTRPSHGPVRWGMSLSNYIVSIKEPVYFSTLARSIRFASECTLISLAVGFPYAYIATRQKRYKKIILVLIAVMPLLLNLLLCSFAWIVILQRNGVINYILRFLNFPDHPTGFLQTKAGVLCGMVYVLTPLMIFPIFTTLNKIPSVYSEAARVMGATPLRSFMSVSAPLVLPGIIAGGMLVFVTSFGLYLVPELLGGPTFSLLPYLIQQQTLEFLNWELASALSVILIIIIFPAVIVVQKLLHRTTSQIYE